MTGAGRHPATLRGLAVAAEAVALLAARAALGWAFWASGRTKVVEGTWLQVSDATRFLFDSEYAGVPLPPAMAATLATHAEFWLPLLLFAGLGTRFAAMGLLGMAATIQVFVYPQAWALHLQWAALALVLVARGGGLLSLDTLLRHARGWSAARSPRPAAKDTR